VTDVALFRDDQDVYEVLGSFFRDAAKDEEMGPEIGKSGLVIQFQYSEPDSVLTIDARAPHDEHGSDDVHTSTGEDYFRVLQGTNDLKPDVLMTMKADVANRFWLGKLNLLAALSRRQIVAKGPIPKILKLLPAIQPAYAKYQGYLETLGRTELLGK
jgi:hypothetical protein